MSNVIELKLQKIPQKPIIILSCIAVIGLILRLYTFPYENFSTELVRFKNCEIVW